MVAKLYQVQFACWGGWQVAQRAGIVDAFTSAAVPFARAFVRSAVDRPVAGFEAFDELVRD